jgi:hypothetical protein
LAFMEEGFDPSTRCKGELAMEKRFGVIAQPFQHGHLFARSLAVETCWPF